MIVPSIDRNFGYPPYPSMRAEGPEESGSSTPGRFAPPPVRLVAGGETTASIN